MTRRCRAWSSRASGPSASASSWPLRSPSCTSCCRRSPAGPRSRCTTSTTASRAGWWSRCCFECLSFGGYVILFRTVFVRGRTRIGWRASYEITMAGVAATRLFAAAGAGGVALTAWALRRSGMEARVVACRMVAFLSLLYAVFMGSIVVFGLGLYFGIFNGPAPFAITVVPAIFALLLIAIFLAMSLLPGDAERRITQWSGARAAARASGQARDVPRLGRRRRALGDRARARPRVGRARRGRLVGLRHRHAVGVLPRLRTRSAALRGHRARLLRRACWPTRCRCRAASAGSTAA